MKKSKVCDELHVEAEKYRSRTRKRKRVIHYTARTKEGRERERHADFGFAAK